MAERLLCDGDKEKPLAAVCGEGLCVSIENFSFGLRQSFSPLRKELKKNANDDEEPSRS